MDPLYAFAKDIPYDVNHYKNIYLNAVSKFICIAKLKTKEVITDKKISEMSNIIKDEFLKKSKKATLILPSSKSLKGLNLFIIKPCCVCKMKQACDGVPIRKRKRDMSYKDINWYHTRCQNDYNKLREECNEELDNVMKIVKTMCLECQTLSNLNECKYVNTTCMDVWSRIKHLKELNKCEKRKEEIYSAICV
jgi:hypothetical protein